ncbi:MAG: radical SAM protein [Spirochaetales bacterium]|nr:radical SAM protein [Spirochaetales bacterium]
MKSIEKHPCFNKDSAQKYIRIHLPVAPKCNIQCHYCNRKYDCVNESRPGVSSGILSPHQALYYYKEMKSRYEHITVAGIAGPGDSLANPDKTLLTLDLIKKEDPDINLCLSTNGLKLPEYCHDLAQIGLSHLTVTINAVDPLVGSKIYRWVRLDSKRYMNQEAAEVLLDRQLAGVEAAVIAGITVKINTIILPGINSDHIPEVAKKMGQLGATLHNCLAFIPVAETPFENVEAPSHSFVAKIREKTGKYIPQMTHCGRCRADAMGLIAKGTTDHYSLIQKIQNMPLNPYEKRKYIAVASEEGILINKHLGQAEEFFIYEISENKKINFIEKREAPLTAGFGDLRWKKLQTSLKDCHTLLVSGVGPRPFDLLTQSGLKIHSLECMIDEALTTIANNGSLNHLNKRESGVCSGCSDQKAGCS